MTTGTSASLCCTLLVVGLFVFAYAEQKIIITADPGQNVTLTCGAPNNNNRILIVEWSRADLGTDYVLVYRDERFVSDDQHPSFVNRVDLKDRQMKDGDVSLILSNVTINDTGTYECYVVWRESTKMKHKSIITLSVAPPGQTGAPVGLIVGLSVFIAFVVAVVGVGFVIYTKKRTERGSKPASC